MWELAAPDLPAEVEPFSFVSAALLRHVARALRLSPGQALADLGCGRGGPGLWLGREAGVSLVGVDFSPAAVDQATPRAALFGMTDRARFVVGDLSSTGLPDAHADAAVSIDAFHLAADPPAAATEPRRILRPAGRLVLTQLAAEDPRRRKAAGQTADRLAAAPARRGLRGRRRGGTARVGRPVHPRLPDRP